MTYIRMLLILIGLLIITGVAWADNALRTGDVYDLPVMYLNNGMDSATQTTGIQFAPPIRNLDEVLIPSMSGAVFEFTRGDQVESVYAQLVQVNATTKVVTLSGTVIRDLCFNQARTFTTCGDGIKWSKGTEIRLVNSSRYYNLKLQVDRSNTCTASGCLSFMGSGSLQQPYFATEAERDRQLGTKVAAAACIIGTGQCYDYIGGAWRNRSGSNVINATESAAGKVQLADVSDQSGSLVTDTVTGAPLVVQARYLTASGGFAMRKRIPLLDNRGYMSGSTLGSNFGSLTSAQKTTMFLRADQTFALPAAGSGVNLQIDKIVKTTIDNLSSTTFAAIDSSGLTGNMSFSVGDTVMIAFLGSVQRGLDTVGKVVLDIQIGNNPISPNSSGAIVLTVDPSSNGARMNASFTLFHTIATGGTLTLRPVYRIMDIAGGGPHVEFHDNTRFQVIKIH